MLQVVGCAALLEWDCGTMEQALLQFHSAGHKLLARFGGYMVEDRPGHLLAVFLQPNKAVEWADSCVQDLLREQWWVGMCVGGACHGP